MYDMQDLRRQISPIELELERVRKFSIIDCIRDELRDVINKLPKKSEGHYQQKIDDVIRRNLLKERKVRFGSAGDKREEPALEEIEVILQVLGNDKNNKLVIENFDLLEKRIKSVEQRLSGLLRKVPDLDHRDRPAVKIDPQRVKTNIQDFVNMFNHVFTSTYEVLTNTNSSLLDETLSSKNRLKFHLLSHLTELKESESDVEMGTKKHTQATDNNTKPGKGKYNSKAYLDKSESKVELPTVKAVDSLITLRQRFRAQSAKWKQLKLNKKTNETEDKTKKAAQPKKPLDVNPRKKKEEELKLTKKYRERDPGNRSCHSLVEDHPYFGIAEDLFDLNYIEKAINESIRKNTREIEKKNDRTKRKSLFNGSQKSKDSSQDLDITDTNELIRSYVNKNILRKPILVTNAKERPTKIQTRNTLVNKIETQSEVRRGGKPSKVTYKYTPMETLYEKFPSKLGTGLKINSQNVLAKERVPQIKSRYNIAFNFDSLEESPEETMIKRTTTLTGTSDEETPKQSMPITEMTDSSHTIIPLYKRESLVDLSGNSNETLDRVDLFAQQSEQTEQCTEKVNKIDIKIPLEEQISDNLFAIDDQDPSQNDIKKGKASTAVNKLLLKENEILNSLIADIADELSKTNEDDDNVVSTVDETQETLPRDERVVKEDSAKGTKIIKDASSKDSKATTEKDKLPKSSKVTNSMNTADTKEKFTRQSQKRTPISTLQTRDRQLKDPKKLDKNKAKDFPPKAIKTKLNTFKKEQQPGSMKIPDNRSSLCKHKTNYSSFLPSMLKRPDSKSSGSSIEVMFKKSSNLSDDTYSKTSLSLLSELKLQRNRANRYKPPHSKM